MLISKIQKNIWLIFVLLGLALLAFILMENPNGRFGGGSGNNEPIGEINGEKIKAQDFYKVADQFNNPNSNENYRLAWNNIIANTINTQECKEAGLNVTNAETAFMFSGPVVDPMVKRFLGADNLPDEQIKQYIKSTNEGDNAEAKLELKQVRDQVANAKTFQKLSALVAASVYTPRWLAEIKNKEQSEQLEFDLVAVPFGVVSPEEATLSDQDYNDYIAENKELLTNKEEKRQVAIVEFSVYPSIQDSALVRESINKTVAALKESTDDSLFVSRENNGLFVRDFLSKDELTSSQKETFFSVPVGTVVGPYVEGNLYQAAKVVGRQSIPDSVDARHIFKQVRSQEEVIAVNKLLDSLKTVLENGGDFVALASQYSDDTPTKVDGGKLPRIGFRSEYSSLPLFVHHLFFSGAQGKYDIVQSRGGFHLVQITNRISSGKQGVKMAYINEPIIAGEKTISVAKAEAKAFLAKHKTVAEIEKAQAENFSASFRISNDLTINDFYVSLLGSDGETRNIVKWAFDKNTTIGTVSDKLYTFKHEQLFYDNKFAVVGLKSIQKAGVMSVEDVKAKYLAGVLTTKQGKLLKEKLKNQSLEAIAAKYSQQITNSGPVTFQEAAIPGKGAEPEFVGKIFNVKPGQISEPFIGRNAVYVAKIINKVPVAPTTNLEMIQKTTNVVTGQKITMKLQEAMKNAAEIKDNRSLYF